MSHVERGMRAAQAGLVVNIALVVKLLAGIAGHSYALIADAIESITDIFSSLVVWGGLRITARPADEDYPYGYGKAEALAAAIVSLMLLVAALAIGVAAVGEILTPHHMPAAVHAGGHSGCDHREGMALFRRVCGWVARRAAWPYRPTPGTIAATRSPRPPLSSASAWHSGWTWMGVGRRLGRPGGDSVIATNGISCSDPIHDLMDRMPDRPVHRSDRGDRPGR